MPTYVCYTATGRLTADQKARVAEAITAAHSEEMAGPRYLVQVVFQDIRPGQIYIGAQPGPGGQIWVRGDVRAGRTDRQRSGLQIRIAREIGGIAACSADDLWIYINELPPVNMMEFGHLLPLPGGETHWLQALPDKLRERLARLEARKTPGVPTSDRRT
jgi:phenylpyruvate tautomerase PptA (4-oxalocrotonate tautomerase family)